jgi:hypothetical protein
MTTPLRVGDFVRVRADIPSLSFHLGKRGEVVKVTRSTVTVRFPFSAGDQICFVRLRIKPGELEKA